RRSPRDHSQATWRHLPQSHDGFRAQAIAEILLRRISTQIFKRKIREHEPCPLDRRRLHHSGDDHLLLEAISLAEHGLDILWMPGMVAESIADLSDRGIYAVIRIEVKILPPKSLDDLFSADQLSLFPHQQDEQVHRNTFQSHRFPGA